MRLRKADVPSRGDAFYTLDNDLLISDRFGDDLKAAAFSGQTVAQPLDIVHGRLDIETLPDLTQTFERFGNSRLRPRLEESHFAQPMIVKPVVCEFFRRHKVRGVGFSPVRVLG